VDALVWFGFVVYVFGGPGVSSGDLVSKGKERMKARNDNEANEMQ
jgi:hypothetical protein